MGRPFKRLRRRLTFAHVVSLVALFVALGGTSWAALRISGSQIKNRSVSGAKLKRNTLGGATIKESRLGKVPRARRADRLGGLTAGQLKVRCPGGTFPVSGVCIEERHRAPAAYGTARVECTVAGRRVASYEEVVNSYGGTPGRAPANGELTSTVSRGAAGSGLVEVLVVTDEVGSATRVPNTIAGARSFRCVAYPSN
jgi:hypothetical protein